MSKPRKIFTIVMWTLVVFAAAGVIEMKRVVAARQNARGQSQTFVDLSGRPIVDDGAPDHPSVVPSDIPVYYAAPDFSLIDQNNLKRDKTELLGHPWIGDFIFTTCANLCPTMSLRMGAMQGRLPQEVKLVSFSVDPLHDTPAALLKYSHDYKAEEGRWIFLTGNVQRQTDVVKGMRLHFRPAEADAPIEHSPDFVLVDSAGNIRGYYDANDPSEIERLVHDVGVLMGKPIAAAIDASDNTSPAKPGANP